MNEATRRVLVIGGAGYVGSKLVPKLLAAGIPVTVLDLYLYGDDVLAESRIDPNLKEIKGDIRDTAAVEAALEGLLGSHPPCMHLQRPIVRTGPRSWKDHQL